jgi:hypothetical protein
MDLTFPPKKVDTGLCGFCLCRLWGDMTDGGADAPPIVIAFDTSEQFPPRGIAIGIFAVARERASSIRSRQPYAGGEYRDILQAAAITESMSHKETCCDNAPMRASSAL